MGQGWQASAHTLLKSFWRCNMCSKALPAGEPCGRAVGLCTEPALGGSPGRAAPAHASAPECTPAAGSSVCCIAAPLISGSASAAAYVCASAGAWAAATLPLCCCLARPQRDACSARNALGIWQEQTGHSSYLPGSGFAPLGFLALVWTGSLDRFLAAFFSTENASRRSSCIGLQC